MCRMVAHQFGDLLILIHLLLCVVTEAVKSKGIRPLQDLTNYNYIQVTMKSISPLKNILKRTCLLFCNSSKPSCKNAKSSLSTRTPSQPTEPPTESFNRLVSVLLNGWPSRSRNQLSRPLHESKRPISSY